MCLDKLERFWLRYLLQPVDRTSNREQILSGLFNHPQHILVVPMLWPEDSSLVIAQNFAQVLDGLREASGPIMKSF